MSLPRASRGQPITATLINSIIDEINKNNLVSISGGSLNKSINGTTLSIQQSAQPAATIIPPFYYSNAPTTAIGVYFNLTAGTVNNYLPDNIFDTFLLSATTPTAADINYVTLECTTNGSAILSAFVQASITAPANIGVNMGNAPATFSALMYVVKGDEPYRVLGQSSIVARATEINRVASATFGIAEFPFNIYYTWSLFS